MRSVLVGCEFDQAETFIARLTGDANSTVIFQTFDDNAASKARHLTSVLVGSLREHWEHLAALAEQGAGVFVAVNEMKGGRRRKENFERARAIFQEDDTGSARLPKIEPHMVVESSPGKFHRYWITSTADAEAWAAVMDRMVQDYDSDKNAKDLARVLRLPGTLHQKNPAAPHMTGIVAITDRPPYTWEEITEAIPPLEAVRISWKPGRGGPPGQDSQIVFEGNRNSYLASEAGKLRRIGLDEQEIDAALQVKNANRCVPPLEVAEVTTIARSVGKYPVPVSTSVDLRTGERGVISDEENILRILQRDQGLTGVVRFDEFRSERILARPISDDQSLVADRHTPRPWRDSDTVALQTYIQRKYMPRIARERIEGALDLYAREHCAFHPLRDYLQGLAWDGTPRLDRWLNVYMGAQTQQSEYLAAVGAKFLIAAVARVFHPGCQVDSALVLEGLQGIGKSTGLRVLASDEYFSDSLPADLSHKDARDHLRGKWIIELSELSQLKRAEIETIKSFLSRRYEQYRPSYGRNEVKFPRQCVFAGSTNSSEYLVDPTGNRRFWVVACGGAVDLMGLERDRDQLWAEAAARYRKGEPWHLTGILANLAAEEAHMRLIHDPWTPDVLEVLGELQQTEVSPGEIMKRLPISTEARHERNAMRVGKILLELGWTRGKRHKARGQLFVGQPPPRPELCAGL